MAPHSNVFFKGEEQHQYENADPLLSLSSPLKWDRDLIDKPFYVCMEYERIVEKVAGVQEEVLLHMSVPSTLQFSFKLLVKRKEHFEEKDLFINYVLRGLGHWCLCIHLKNIDYKEGSYTCFVYHANTVKFDNFLKALIEQNVFEPILLFSNHKKIFFTKLSSGNSRSNCHSHRHQEDEQMASSSDELEERIMNVPNAIKYDRLTKAVVTNAINYDYCNMTHRFEPDNPISRNDRLSYMVADVVTMRKAANNFNPLTHPGLRQCQSHFLDFIVSESGVCYTKKELDCAESENKTYVIQTPTSQIFMSIPADCGALYTKNGFC